MSPIETTTLAVIGDVHAHWKHLDRVVRRIQEVGADGVLLVGDLGSNVLGFARQRDFNRFWTYRKTVDGLFERLAPLGLPTLWVPGNHDDPGLTGSGNVDRRGGAIRGLRITGIGGAGPDLFGFPYEWREDEIRALELPEADVLLCHAPPRDTQLDFVPRAGHVGSAAIRERAEAHRGFLVCGHIHESAGAQQIGDCLCLNVGALGQPYGKPQVGFIRRGPEGDEATLEDLASGQRRVWRRTDRT